MFRLRVPFQAMASVHEITVDAADEPTARRAVGAAIAEVHRIEAKYTRYRDDSVTSAINRAAGHADVAIDEETAALLRYADQCHALSGGRFALTSGVLRRAWDFKAERPRVPDAARIEALRALVGWQHVRLADDSVALAKPGMELDFGGIGKEYAADRAATILAAQGIAHALVNLAGDLRALGGQGDGRPWRIGIRHPREPEPAVIASLELVDGAIATSGDYERYFEHEGRRYCHLLDARTGMPVSAWQSISVVGPLAIVAGSCSTIAMLLEDGAVEFLAAQRVHWLGVDAAGALHGPARAASIDPAAS
jgi:FAD:protein FMN transferase